MQQYAEDAVAHHSNNFSKPIILIWEKKKPWDSKPTILQNAIHNSHAYKILKNQGLNEK